MGACFEGTSRRTHAARHRGGPADGVIHIRKPPGWGFIAAGRSGGFLCWGEEWGGGSPSATRPQGEDKGGKMRVNPPYLATLCEPAGTAPGMLTANVPRSLEGEALPLVSVTCPRWRMIE